MDEPDADVNLRILIVCTGNTHRSPFAEGVLRLRLEERGLTDIAVASGGLSASEGDPVPVDAVVAAAEWGVDLSGHRARQISAEMIREADLILLMDGYHLTALATAFPTEREKLYALALFDPAEDRSDIDDPAEMDGEGLRSVYARIALCAAEVADYYATP
jgi:protein-tyrosine-phosphatase